MKHAASLFITPQAHAGPILTLCHATALADYKRLKKLLRHLGSSEHSEEEISRHETIFFENLERDIARVSAQGLAACLLGCRCEQYGALFSMLRSFAIWASGVFRSCSQPQLSRPLARTSLRGCAPHFPPPLVLRWSNSLL
jgi:hypothetical protein